LDVGVGQIAKSLVFLADDAPVMVVASGADRVDVKRLSNHLGGAKIGRADADIVRSATGYPIGGVSPAGLTGAVRVMVDRALGESAESGSLEAAGRCGEATRRGGRTVPGWW
jgi:prolyl-tRNA editing enzyme YbaK/EbsC (Cys-tRNA(Pro) deacylase)